jgi:hypothetical protein
MNKCTIKNSVMSGWIISLIDCQGRDIEAGEVSIVNMVATSLWWWIVRLLIKKGISLTCVLECWVFVRTAFRDLVSADSNRAIAAELLRSYEHFLACWLICRQSVGLTQIWSKGVHVYITAIISRQFNHLMSSDRQKTRANNRKWVPVHRGIICVGTD